MVLKQKDKISLIKDALKDLTPELDKKYILDKANTTINQKEKMKSFSIFAYAGSLATIFIIGILIILAGSQGIFNKDTKYDSDNDAIDDEDKSPEDDSAYILAENEIIGFSGLTIVTLLENNISNIDYNNANKNIKFLSQYIKTIEHFRSYYRYSNFYKSASDLIEYEEMLTYNIIDLNRESNSYKIYYNHELSNVLINHNNIIYNIEVSKEFINEKIVYNFKYTIDANEILISMKTKNTFEIEIYSNNVLVSSSSISINENQLILKDLSTNEDDQYSINFVNNYSDNFVIKYYEYLNYKIISTGTINVTDASSFLGKYYYKGFIGENNINIVVGNK